jgi:hypothetical protein
MEAAMGDEFTADDVRNAWQNHNLPVFRMSPAAIRIRIEQFDKKIIKRKWKGYAVCVAAIVSNIVLFFAFSNLLARIGAALTAWGAGYILYQVRLYHLNRNAAAASAAKTDTAVSAEFLRAELQRIRDFTCGIWLWSRALMILPRPLVFLIGLQASFPGIQPFVYAEMALFLILLAMAVPINLRISRKYQREIDELKNLQMEK